MNYVLDLADQLFTHAGEHWASAYGLVFLSMIFDSARPREEGGENRTEGVAAFVLGAANLVSPFLLFISGFWAVGGGGPFAWAAVVFIIFFLVLGSSLIGWFVGKVAPNFGRILHTASPWAALAALAFTANATWPNLLAAWEYFT